jgi:hypothetical protein
VTLDRLLQVGALARLLAAIALDVSSARLAHGATVLTLRHRPTLLVDVLQWPIRMLAIANPVAANASLACIFLSVD